MPAFRSINSFTALLRSLRRDSRAPLIVKGDDPFDWPHIFVKPSEW
jgi:hypothetical protein